MSPERTLQSTDVLEESSRIADALLAVENEVGIFARAERERRLSDIRQVLGYQAVSEAEAFDLVDSRIEEKVPVITPEDLTEVLPLTHESAETTRQSRQAIAEIIKGEDDRLVVIVGPCSIHDPAAALEYASHVKEWRDSYGEDLEIVMRFYPEKPRTEKDWKGFIYDPKLDDSDDINQGIVATRMLACQITGMGVPIAMERLNALTPQYVNGLVAYDAIGARNTLDQKAREYASGTSSPVGFKNTPEGSVLSAIQAVSSANKPHSFLGMGMNGTPHQIVANGNELAHIILRGDKDGPNYSPKHIENAKKQLADKGLLEAIGIDASHDNSGKNAGMQPEVVFDISEQVSQGESAIKMVMIESNLVHGRQDRHKAKTGELVYGQSITDECVGIEDTENMLEVLAASVNNRRLIAA